MIEGSPLCGRNTAVLQIWQIKRSYPIKDNYSTMYFSCKQLVKKLSDMVKIEIIYSYGCHSDSLKDIVCKGVKHKTWNEKKEKQLLQPNWFRAGGGRLGGRSGQPLAIPPIWRHGTAAVFPAGVPYSRADVRLFTDDYRDCHRTKDPSVLHRCVQGAR